jgi:hypothetical protein
MNLIATTVGAGSFLVSAHQAQLTLGGDWRVRLWSNNVVVNDATAWGALTEATFPGYVYVQPAWPAVSFVAGAWTLVSPTVTFTQTSAFPSTSYGVYVTDALNSTFVGCGNFSPSITLTVSQPSYSVQVNVTCKPEF